MLRKLKKISFFLLFNCSACFYDDAFSQQLVCVDYAKLLTDSTELHDYRYPYLKVNKTINSLGDETGLIVSFQDFYQNLLYDIDTLNFELYNFKNKKTQILKVPVDDKFKLHKLKPRYQVDGFYVVDDKLYLLVFNAIYIYEISTSKACRFLRNYEINKNGFEWFSMVNQNSGVLFRSIPKSNQGVEFLKFKIKNNKIIISDSLHLPFDGLKYLYSESTFISDDNNLIIIGNATSSKVIIIDKKNLNVKTTFYHSKLVNSDQNDTPNYNNKFAFHNSIHSDSNNFHYQTCYYTNNTIYRSRSKIVGEFPHFLDVYKLTESGWDSVQTLCEGLYNFKRFRDTTELFGIMHFDPMSSVNAKIAINGSLFSVGLSYELFTDYTANKIPFYKFPIAELVAKGKSLKDKTFKFNLYEYKLVD